MKRRWLCLALAAIGCEEDVDDEAADLSRPSGLVSILRSEARSDLVIADAEADGLRVLQLGGGDGTRVRTEFVPAPAVFEPLLVPAPGFPTVASAFAGRGSDELSDTRRVFALAPGADALHATWIPSLPVNVATTEVEGHRLIGTLAISGSADTVSASGVETPLLSLLDVDPGLADFVPVDFVVMDERPFPPPEDCSASTAVLTRGLLLLQARAGVATPGALVGLDLLTTEPDEPCDLRGADFPILTQTEGGTLGARAARISGPRFSRRLVRLPEGLVVVTTDDLRGQAGLVRVPPLDEALSLQLSTYATGGPASAAFALPQTVNATVSATESSTVSFGWLRSDEPIMELYQCKVADSVDCALSPLELSGPYDDPELRRASGPGVLVLREAPVVAAAFGRSPLSLIDVLGGVATVVADEDDEEDQAAEDVAVPFDPDRGIAALVHQDGVVSILAGSPNQLSYVTRRTLTFIEEGRVTSPPQRRLAEIFPRNELGFFTRPPNCVNQTTPEAVQTELDNDRVVVGEAPFACIDDPTTDETPNSTVFPTLRAPTACPGLEEEPRPLDGILRASFRGPFFERDGAGLGDALFEFGASTITIFYENVDPSVDFVESEIRVGDAVHFFATCDAIDGPDIEVSVASTSSVAAGAGVVSLVEPQRVRFDFEGFTELALETSPVQLPYDPALQGPFDFQRLCESVRVNRLEIFPRGREAVLTRETDGGDILEVIERVPVNDEIARFTRGVAFDWQAFAPEGFRCENFQGVDRRDPETGQLPDEEEDPAEFLDVACANSTDCGPGRTCDGGEARTCPGRCARNCSSFGDCFVGLVQRACPEIQLGINGDEPLVVDLNPANTRAGGVRFPGAVPDAAVHVPNRDAFFISFPGSRTLQELRVSSGGITRSIIR